MPTRDLSTRSDWLTGQLETLATPRDGMGVLHVFFACSNNPARYQPVARDLQQAMARSEPWWFQWNAVELAFDPTTGLVTASFSPLGVFDPPEQTMPAAQFLPLLLTWMDDPGSADEPRKRIITQVEFEQVQKKFAQTLRRLIQIPNQVRGRNLDVDAIVGVIGTALDGTEDLTGLIVETIPNHDRRLRECMVTQGHVLADVPSPELFGERFASDEERGKRYELVAALMVASGFPAELLDDSSRFERWRFRPTSNFFKDRKQAYLNEQFISCWCRRLLCYFGKIPNVGEGHGELRDSLARGERGMTTEDLLRKELLQRRCLTKPREGE